MPRFKVEIRGEGLERALGTLNGAGIPTMGPSFSGWGDDPSTMTVGREMFAVVHAASAEAAEDQVKDNLPADGDYTILPAGPFPPEDQ